MDTWDDAVLAYPTTSSARWRDQVSESKVDKETGMAPSRLPVYSFIVSLTPQRFGRQHPPHADRRVDARQQRGDHGQDHGLDEDARLGV